MSRIQQGRSGRYKNGVLALLWKVWKVRKRSHRLTSSYTDRYVGGFLHYARVFFFPCSDPWYLQSNKFSFEFSFYFYLRLFSNRTSTLKRKGKQKTPLRRKTRNLLQCFILRNDPKLHKYNNVVYTYWKEHFFHSTDRLSKADSHSCKWHRQAVLKRESTHASIYLSSNSIKLITKTIIATFQTNKPFHLKRKKERKNKKVIEGKLKREVCRIRGKSRRRGLWSPPSQ